MKTETHIGYLIGSDARTPDKHRVKVSLRETKLYWIHNTIKYRKRDGRGVGDWPLYRLDIDSIEIKEAP